MNKLVFGGALLAMIASSAAAQTPSAPQQPQPAPPAQPQFYRFTLVDGRVLDVQVVGGDANNYWVQTGGARYSIARTQVASSIALAPVAYAPPPPPPYTPPPDERNLLARNPRAAGWVYFASAYLITAPIALAKRDTDKDASLGLIPVVGPMLWAGVNDEDDLFEDGWDWLAGFDTLIQATGVYFIVAGGSSGKTTNAVTLSPLSGRGTHGVVFSGTF